MTIPENITQKIGLEIGDSFEWLTYDPKNNIVRLKLWKNENKETY